MQLLFLALLCGGCATAFCPDSGTGLGNTCGQGTSSNSSTNSTGTGQLYVSNSGASTLARFASATTVQSDVLPTAFVRGVLTRLSSPGYLTLDTANDRLYVPNAGDNSILVWDKISQASENAPPTRFIQGAGTQLSGPIHIEIDSANDLLYVANRGNNSVTVFSSASTIQGNTAPVRTLSGAATQITAISALHIDTANNRLWVVNPTSNALLVFDNALSLNGGPPPNRVVSGSNTLLSSPQYLLQTGTRLYISCGNGSILRFEGADALSGSVAPAATITGSLTNLAGPRQLVYRSDADELYVADGGAGAIWVFSSASTANGGPVPIRKIQGTNPGFSGLQGMALDLSR